MAIFLDLTPAGLTRCPFGACVVSADDVFFHWQYHKLHDLHAPDCAKAMRDQAQRDAINGRMDIALAPASCNCGLDSPPPGFLAAPVSGEVRTGCSQHRLIPSTVCSACRDASGVD